MMFVFIGVVFVPFMYWVDGAQFVGSGLDSSVDR